MSKICTGCHIDKSASEYATRAKDKLYERCKLCQYKTRSDRQTRLRIERETSEYKPIEQKACTSCNTEKSIICFGIDRYSIDGYTVKCKECHKKTAAFKRKERSLELANGKRTTLTEKVCSRCKVTKPSTEFSISSGSDVLLKSCCKTCRNKDSTTRRIAYKALTSEIKSLAGCEICGERNPLLLDFDHLDPKLKEFNVSRQHTMVKALKEIAKCRVLCVAHHREHSSHQIAKKGTKPKRARVIRNIEYVAQIKLQIGECQHCGLKIKSGDADQLCQFDFDHIERLTKVEGISRLSNIGTSLKTLKSEIAKCQLLCCGCHRIKTSHERTEIKKNKLNI